MISRALSLLLLLTGCARTALSPPCPLGMTAGDGGTCACVSDRGCPEGMQCTEGVCVCRDTSCCPAGYEWSDTTSACVCRASECCPKDHHFREDVSRCECGAEECCPGGYAFDGDAGGCVCAGEECCPQGFGFEADGGVCVCQDTSCCPVDHRFDEVREECVCAKDECCPPDHAYDEVTGACVCQGDTCCPAGFRQDEAKRRCVCIDDASCGAGRVCDGESGLCKCLDNSGCASNQYCNDFGFCQALTSCTSNRDCPSGWFCDVSSDTCAQPLSSEPNAPCFLDEHCPFGQRCSSATARCETGCRRDADCPLKSGCISGRCESTCRGNDWCGVNQFCDGGTCATRSDRTDCRDCSGGGCGPNALCLVFISEGQQRAFCGTYCESNVDCPSGFDCGQVVYSCAPGARCPSDPEAPGETITCSPFLVENEEGTKYYCADSSGQPHPYAKACAPSSGFCPASAPP